MGDLASDSAEIEPQLGRPDEPPVWLTVAEAARVTGEHPERLRSLARRGKLHNRRGNRWLEILIESGRARPTNPQSRPHGRPDRLKTEPDQNAAEAAILRDRIGQLEETVAELKEELGEAKVAVAQAQGERDVARAIESELRTMLAEARRPWWRRLLDS